MVGWGGVVGEHSHFNVKPNYSIEVVLCRVVVGVGVVTISDIFSFLQCKYYILIVCLWGFVTIKMFSVSKISEFELMGFFSV